MEEKNIEKMTLDEKVEDFYKYFQNKKEYNLLLERAYGVGIYKDLFLNKKNGRKEYEEFDNLWEIIRYYNEVATRNEDNVTVMKSYLYSNENLDILFGDPMIDVRDKDVVLVGTGACQMYNCLLKGAKNITICDANLILRPFVELKSALIATMELERFLNYYDYYFPENFFKYHEVYAKASHMLSDESKSFWDTMMLEGDKEMLANLCHRDCCRHGSKFYKDENEYIKLQKILRDANFKVNYIVGNYSDFPKLLNGKFSFISFSNISDYYGDDESFINPLVFMYNNNLLEDGVIQVNSRVYENVENSKKKHLEKFLTNSKAFVIKNSGLIHTVVGDNIPVAHSSIIVRKNKENYLEKKNKDEITK